MATPLKLTCNVCGCFIGLIRSSEDYPTPDADCCVAYVIAARAVAYENEVAEGLRDPDYGRWTGGGPGRSKWGSGSKEDDLGPWGENAVRDLEDCR